MAKKYVIETTATGRKQWAALKRSHSHHHHLTGHHEYYRVTQEEWNAMVERERELQKSNKGLENENDTLKAALLTSQADIHRLNNHVVPRLQDQVASLFAENQSLRRSIDNVGDRNYKHHREVDRLNLKIEKLETENKLTRDENEDLRVRIKALSKQLDQGFNRRINELIQELDHWKEHFRHIKERYDYLKQQHEKLLDALEARTRKMEAYEDILKRRGII
ncbi:hypothetical protein B0I35DRAFT_428236 [Stachybotrys elegans]|uniref:Uncharacterized protein n=1 Tax=Stachybotrys elegans TaxID=80388 RepID=A0A8K0WSL7_9HYPO|nr:hypothetical protein B0I35DRAFT_428236 [Stachybotrys elegans]